MWRKDTVQAEILDMAKKATGARYIANQASRLLDSGDTESYMIAALEDIVANFPPKHRYPPETLQGLWSGPTGIGYLLLQVSVQRPDLVICGQTALAWAQAYMGSSRGYNLRLGCHGCGISDERLAFEAVLAAVSKDMRHVRDFISSASQVTIVDEFPDENLYGRAGLLYLLRLVRHWVPESNRMVDPVIAEISNTILKHGPEWTWHGRRYLGAAHGDIGIVLQLVLTSPELAPQIEPVLGRLLDEQLPSGNWAVSETTNAVKTSKELVQFCHGAPGFVASLLSLRQHFPKLESRIDEAVAKAQNCIWREGLLTKEPNLCHGIFGNALTLPRGGQREHFLGVAAPENVSRLKGEDEEMFMRADYGRSYSTLTSYAPSAVWTWLVHREESPRVLAYNDV